MEKKVQSSKIIFIYRNNFFSLLLFNILAKIRFLVNNPSKYLYNLISFHLKSLGLFSILSWYKIKGESQLKIRSTFNILYFCVHNKFNPELKCMETWFYKTKLTMLLLHRHICYLIVEYYFLCVNSGEWDRDCGMKVYCALCTGS